MLTPEQMEIRRTRIGSSDIAAIVGEDPYRSAMSVFNAKMFPGDETASPEMEWGQDVESAILAWHAHRENKQIIGTTTLVHPTLAFVCATPDAYLAEGEYRPDLEISKVRVCEAKNVGWYRADTWGSEGDDAPPKFLAQVHWQVGVAKAAECELEVIDEADLVPSIGGTPPRVYRVRFDPELFGILLERAEKFVVDHLRTGKPPAFDGSGAGDEYLRRRYSVQREELLPATEEAITLHRALLTMEATCEAANAERQMLAQQLKDAIGEAAGMVGVGTWRKAKDGSRRFLPVRPKKSNGTGARP